MAEQQETAASFSFFRSPRHWGRQMVRSSIERSRLNKSVVWSVFTARNAVALTFDDGPHPVYTPQILDILRASCVHATFFAVGENARRHPELIQRIVHEGHTLGCHTNTHADLTRLSVRQVWQECQEGRKTLECLSGTSVAYLRPPWGRLNFLSAPAILLNRMKIVLWSLDSLDCREPDPQRLIAYLKQKQPVRGDILLLHDDGSHTVEALPHLLQYLHECQLDCLSLDELMAVTK